MDELELMIEEMNNIFNTIRKNATELKELVIDGTFKRENNNILITKEGNSNYIIIWRGM